MKILHQMKKALLQIPNSLQFLRIQPVERPYPVEASSEDLRIMQITKSLTMTSESRLWASISAAKYVARNQVPGAIVECGVWRGGSALAMVLALQECGVQDREVFLYDTYEGMTAPSNIDIDIRGVPAEKLLEAASREPGDSVWCVADLDDVKQNLAQAGYPENLVYFVQGDVGVTLNESSNLPSSIAILRLDTDWFESTATSLEVLFPRLVRGGVCIIDDYGHWGGARAAVDEYFEKNNIHPLLHVTDYTGRMFLKF